LLTDLNKLATFSSLQLTFLPRGRTTVQPISNRRRPDTRSGQYTRMWDL